MKTSAVKDEHLYVKAPAVVIDDQDDLKPLFDAGKLQRDCVIVVRGQGPQSNGMPELHKLMPILGSLQDQGFRVALVTDGRMSGASGKVPAAIHVAPEALAGGLIGKVQTGDMICVDPLSGALTLDVEADILVKRADFTGSDTQHGFGMGRELFTHLRNAFTLSEEGARTFQTIDEVQAHVSPNQREK